MAVIMRVRHLMVMVVLMGRRVVVFMAVVPEFGLVEQEKEHQADQQRHEQAVRRNLALEGFGQQVQKGRAHQRARSQAQHVLGVT